MPRGPSCFLEDKSEWLQLALEKNAQAPRPTSSSHSQLLWLKEQEKWLSSTQIGVHNHALLSCWAVLLLAACNPPAVIEAAALRNPASHLILKMSIIDLHLPIFSELTRPQVTRPPKFPLLTDASPPNNVTLSFPSPMNSFLNCFSTTSAGSQIRRANLLGAEAGDFNGSDAAWGSEAGFRNSAQGVPTFSIPGVADPTAFLRSPTDDADPSCRIKMQHGTTTLAFCFQGGVVVAVDSRATAGSYVASGTVKKVIEINPYLLGTLAGTAGKHLWIEIFWRILTVNTYWETYLGMHCRLHELRNGDRISVAAASKYLSNLVYSYKGMGLGMGTMICGWDKTGPSVYYVDADGSRLKGNLFSVGSGSTHAYGVLDQGYRWDLSTEEAHDLARRSIYAAGHRDAYTGTSCNLYHIEEAGWRFIGNYDISTMHYEGVGDAARPGKGYGYDIRVSGRSSANPPGRDMVV